jgi:holliday junction DNA helicase RuvA
MFYSLSGQLIAKGTMPLNDNECYCVVETPGGVAYQLLCTADTLYHLPTEGDPCQLYTRLIVRADDHLLVGFTSRLDRDVFNLLMGASGVGLKGALSLLSGLGAQAVVGAIASGEHKPLTAAKGVGPKLAQKLVLELKDKLGKWRPPSGETLPKGVNWPTNQEATAGGPSLPPEAVRETEALLLSLGYSELEVHQSLSAVQTNQAPELWATCQTQWLVKEALGWLAKQAA